MLGKQTQAELENKGDGGEAAKTFQVAEIKRDAWAGMVEALRDRREAVGQGRRKARGVPPGLLFGNPPLLETSSSAAGSGF